MEGKVDVDRDGIPDRKDEPLSSVLKEQLKELEASGDPRGEVSQEDPKATADAIFAQVARLQQSVAELGHTDTDAYADVNETAFGKPNRLDLENRGSNELATGERKRRAEGESDGQSFRRRG